MGQLTSPFLRRFPVLFWYYYLWYYFFGVFTSCDQHKTGTGLRFLVRCSPLSPLLPLSPPLPPLASRPCRHHRRLFFHCSY